MNYLTRAAEAARRWRESQSDSSLPSLGRQWKRESGGEHTEGENQPSRVKGMRQKREKRNREFSLFLFSL